MNSNSDSMHLNDFGYEESLNRVMSLKSLVFFGFAYMCPTAIFTVYGLVTSMTHGMLALTYVIATIAMLFTALSYSHMVKAYPIAGSVYSYVTRSIHPYLGFLSGWTILMDYVLLPLLNVVAAGVFINAFIPSLPPWVVILLMITISTIINCCGIKMASIVDTILVFIAFVFLAIVIIFSFKWIFGEGGSGTLLDVDAFINISQLKLPEVGFSAILSGASILALSFLGFDSVTTLSEETVDAPNNVSKAILIICIGAGVGFTLIAYIMQLAWPTGWCDMSNIEAGFMEYLAHISGSAQMIFVIMAIIVITISAGASTIAAQSSASRILFGMGRDGALPKKVFGYIHPRFKTPVFNIILIGAVGITGLVMNLELATSLVNFGALIGFVLVNLSVVFCYYIKRKQHNVFKYLIIPLIGAIICTVIWLNLATPAKIVGFSWLALGFIWLLYITKLFKRLPPEMKFKE